MSHSDVLAAIVARGGRLVASFTLDEQGRTVGARQTHNNRTRCGACGERGHTVKRCMGPGVPPRPTYEERRRR